MNSVVGLLVLFLVSPVYADIYRWVDESGNEVYSDEPRTGAEKVNPSPATVYSPTITPELTIEEEQAGEEEAAEYKLTITSPQDDKSLWVNNGNVSVSLNVEPALADEDMIRVFLDGQVAGEPSKQLSHNFENLDRGTHKFTAEVLDGNGQILTSTSISFHLHRASLPKNQATQTPIARPAVRNSQ